MPLFSRLDDNSSIGPGEKPAKSRQRPIRTPETLNSTISATSSSKRPVNNPKNRVLEAGSNNFVALSAPPLSPIYKELDDFDTNPKVSARESSRLSRNGFVNNFLDQRNAYVPGNASAVKLSIPNPKSGIHQKKRETAKAISSLCSSQAD